MTLVLYVGTKNLSSWSLRPFLALAHAKVPFECRTIKLDQPSTTAEIHAAGNPTGKVPFLLHDGVLVQDSLAICEYVNELHPEARLWPADRTARARARAISCEMHAGFAALRSNMPMNVLGKKPGVGHTPEALADVKRIEAIWHEALAASKGPFLFGDFTIADAMFGPVTTRITTYGVEVDSVCRAYIEAVQGTAAFQRWKTEAAAEA